MNERHVEALEQELMQDVAEFQRSLAESNPRIDPVELRRMVGEYAARRKAALGLFMCAST